MLPNVTRRMTFTWFFFLFIWSFSQLSSLGIDACQVLQDGQVLQVITKSELNSSVHHEKTSAGIFNPAAEEISWTGRWEPQGDRFWTSKLKQVSTLNNETLLHSTPNSATAERGTSRNWRLESHCHRDRSWIWLVLTIPSTLNTFYCSWTCQTEPVGVLGDCLCTPGRIFICMLVWEMVVLCMYTCIYMWTRVFVLHQPLFSYF